MIGKAIVPTALLLLRLAALAKAEAPNERSHPLVPAVYVFGDSLVDVGNNNYLSGGPDGRSDYPHYGIDYPGGKPTGRYCNGYIAVDFLAQKLGFRESPPAVLSVGSLAQETAGGLNFASGGSGILDTTRPHDVLSMNDQIAHFRRAAQLLADAKGVESARQRLTDSLFFVSTGSNDLFVYATLGPQNASHTDCFISSLAAQLGSQLRTLYGLGARRFTVFGAPQIGCAPVARELDPNGGCNEYMNGLATQYNTALKRELKSIATSPDCKGMRYSHFDLYGLVEAILEDPRKFGFAEVVKACCGNGRFNGATPCLPNATYCANRDDYLLWDWSHPTQAAYKIVADWAYDGPTAFAYPINIHTLIK